MDEMFTHTEDGNVYFGQRVDVWIDKGVWEMLHEKQSGKRKIQPHARTTNRVILGTSSESNAESTTLAL